LTQPPRALRHATLLRPIATRAIQRVILDTKINDRNAKLCWWSKLQFVWENSAIQFEMVAITTMTTRVLLALVASTMLVLLVLPGGSEAGIVQELENETDGWGEESDGIDDADKNVCFAIHYIRS
jgi:hypothetical protein